MDRAVTVEDRAGRVVRREDGRLLDGDRLYRSVMMTDGARGVSGAVLAAGARLLGDAFDEGAFTGMTDAGARHEIVRRKLGDAAAGKSGEFLEAAWRTLTGDAVLAAPTAGAAPALVLTDEQQAIAREGVRRAMAMRDAAGRPSGGTADRELRTARDAVHGVYDAERRKLADAWRGGPPEPAPCLDPRTEAAFRDGRIPDNDRNRAMAEMAQRISDGWKPKPRAA